MGRNPHHCSGAVIREHVIGDPDGQDLVRQWIDHAGTYGDASFWTIVTGSFQCTEPGDFGLEGCDGFEAFGAGELFNQGMFRCQHHVGGPGECVGACGENRDGCRVMSDHLEGDLSTFGTTDPVGLHGANTLRPSLQLIQVLQKPLGVVRDAKKPLVQLSLLHQCTGAPGTPIGVHLLVGQHGLVHRIPVHRGVLAVGQAAIEQLNEQPLGPAVVVAVTGRLFPIPVDGQTKPLQLTSHLLDIAVGPVPWIDVAFDRSVLRWKSEGIPAHGMEHRPAAHPLNSCDHIRDHVITHMTHVQCSRGIRKHRQGIKAVVVNCFRSRIQTVSLPARLPALFNIGRGVTAVHG